LSTWAVLMCLWRAEAEGKMARQRIPGACCHLHMHFESPEGVPELAGVSSMELVSIEGVLAKEFIGLSISFWMAEARKSSLLVPIPLEENVVSKDESGSIHELLLYPSIVLSKWLLNMFALDMLPMVAGEVGWLSSPKFIKPLDRPLPWAMEVFHKSRFCCDAEG
jgi:hypothetical protein